MPIPAWITNKSVVVVRTDNGFAVAPREGAQVSECVVFETFASLTAYLQTNFAPTAA